MDRNDLIKSLSAAMAGDLLPDVEDVNTGHFNSSTGTFYCNLQGKQVAEAEIASAIRYFRSAANELASSPMQEKKDKARFCVMAAEALAQVSGVNA